MAMVWDVGTGKRLMAHSVGSRANLAKATAVFGLGGRRVACNSPQLLESDTGRVVAELAPQGQVTCLAASSDGQLLATGMAMGTVHITEFATGSKLAMIGRQTGLVRALAFNADGSGLLIGSHDGAARLVDVRRYDRDTASEIHLLQGHEGSVESVAFSTNGDRFVTGSADGTVRIWDADLGHELLKLPGQRDYPAVVALSPDGTRVVAAAADNAMRIWGLSNAEIVRARQQRWPQRTIQTSQGEGTMPASPRSGRSGGRMWCPGSSRVPRNAAMSTRSCRFRPRASGAVTSLETTGRPAGSHTV